MRINLFVRLFVVLVALSTSLSSAAVIKGNSCGYRSDGNQYSFSSLSSQYGVQIEDKKNNNKDNNNNNKEDDEEEDEDDDDDSDSGDDDGGDLFYFGFCNAVQTPEDCDQNDYCVAWQVDDDGGCLCLGIVTDVTIALGNAYNGDNFDISVTYGSGDANDDGISQSIQYQLTCDNGAGDGDPAIGGYDDDYGVWSITWQASAGCSREVTSDSTSMTSAEWLASLTVCGFAAYCVVGSLYRYQVMDQRGASVVPHKHFWNDLPNLVQEGMQFSVISVKDTANRLTGRADTVPTTNNNSTRHQQQQPNPAPSPSIHHGTRTTDQRPIPKKKRKSKPSKPRFGEQADDDVPQHPTYLTGRDHTPKRKGRKAERAAMMAGIPTSDAGNYD